MRLLKTTSILCFAAVSLLLVWSCSKSDSTNGQTEASSDQLGKLTIEYPLDGAMFPLEVAPSTFIWKDDSGEADTWLVRVVREGEAPIVEKQVSEQSWKPNTDVWQAIKVAALEKPVSIIVQGGHRVDGEHNHDSWVSSDEISIRTSDDPVGAPIFFREVPLPFDYANKYPEKIRYRLGYVSESHESRVLMDNLPLCGNCHSASDDGRTFGMDVDYANDKGSYVITDLEKHTDLTPDKIITWSDYKREDGTLTFGLLSRVSPDGDHVVSTVKDRSIFVGLPENLAYSQLFFPIQGIIASYRRETGEFKALSGADNPEYVQSNPSWSPDGETLFFARSRAHQLKNADDYTSAIIPKEAAAEFLSGGKKFKYDIYKIPFNNGEGGEAVPLEGASNNGKSNYFPKVTPDGKWVVFTQAESFMLLQPDSRLYIVPAEGGVAREMNANTVEMNSWHSFSPNGRWMVFSSKARGPYTQLWLTHIDEDGNDTPPVLLEHLMTEDRAANIPEFLNVEPDSIEKLVDQFSEGGNYHYRVAKNLLRYGELEDALRLLDKAAEIQPDNPDVFLERGALHSQLNNDDLAMRDFKKAIAIAPTDFRGPFNLGLAKEFIGDLDGALESINKAVELNPMNFNIIAKRGLLQQKIGKVQGAVEDFDKALELNPKSADLFNLRGDIKREAGDFEGAFRDFDKAIALKPDLGSAWLNRSFAYLSQNEWKKARNDLDEARVHTPEAPLRYVIEALVAFNDRDHEKGCSVLEAAKSKGRAMGGYQNQVEHMFQQACISQA
ncbi:tetratricopeptide repeat protein [Microbulbifer rhizosphaerae]|uniref:Tetratricopeptide (TPR) repeat protein n=1 Tax=Microbulbifer rhizosphaerae TaxID=1562603 RepID=A0A7W4WFM1_9GAMM|nr:tetratricopeptide repeat protein [Microbulbifer rhizosphaerae]MBB3062736.1 tetratricopeptide (TPR) repeat protein [Microbulbifer rhizosphaerae]